jgi:adenylate cyclase class IV
VTSSNLHLEVEIRYYFDSYGEAYNEIPFLQACLQNEDTWITSFYGQELFKSGRLLRFSNVSYIEEEKSYLSWKGPDIGEFANIRQELDEDITAGFKNSIIMKELGGKTDIGSTREAIRELERLGHRKFMSFWGRNNGGHYEPLNIDVKLMFCPLLKYPIMVEIEKAAVTEEEAKQCENELYELSRGLKLQDRLVKEEPPTLLYQTIFEK